MEELALARSPGAGPSEAAMFEYNEPIADINFNRKKMLQLEQGIDRLQKASRQQTQVVSQLESLVKATISETDLRRVLGLAFQEFEHRLEDAFQDSSRKCLAMFSRRDEVTDLQGQIAKRVSWAEHNSVMKKLADLKQYIDTMADSVFVGHREALNSEFAKKADKVLVEESLRSKADIDSVHEVMARLERLEVLLSHADARQTAALEGLREGLTADVGGRLEKAQALIQENFKQITDLKVVHDGLTLRVEGAEAGIAGLGERCDRLREVQVGLQASQDDVILPKVSNMQGNFDRIDRDLSSLHEALQALAAEASEFRDDSRRTVQSLSSVVNSSKEHLDFLLQEAEAIKRRARELAKKHGASIKEVADGQERLAQQLQAIERDVKRQSRDVRAIENRSAKDIAPLSALEGLRALPASFPSALTALPPPPAENDGNARLLNVMEQLEKLAFGGPCEEQPPVSFNLDRPPLPVSGKQALGSELTLPSLSGLLGEQAPIDSARGTLAVNSARASYGLSPRLQQSRGPAKKKR